MANTFIFDDDDQPDTGGSITPEQDDDQPPEEEGEGGNRTFTLIMIGLGVLFVLALLCVGGFWLLNRNTATANTLAATNEFETQQVVFATQTQDALLAIPTLAATDVLTETPTATPVVVIFASETPDANLPTIDPVIATAEVQQTQLVETQQAIQKAQTVTATFQANATPGKGTPGKGTGTPNKLSQTGFADEVGLPALVILTVILLGVILLARRLRTVPGR